MKLLSACIAFLLFFTGASAAGEETPAHFFSRGVEYFEAGEHQSALESFQKALELKPDYHEVRFNLAIVYWTIEEYVKAAETLEELVEQAPGHELAEVSRGHLEKLGEIIAPPVEPDEEVMVVPLFMDGVDEDGLIAHLAFGVTSRRIESASQLGVLATDKAVAALSRTAANTSEKPSVRSAAAIALSTIGKPRAFEAVDRVLGDGRFELDVKFQMLRNLANQNNPDAFQLLLRHWVRREWPRPPDPPMGLEIERKEWPEDLHDGKMWELTQALGRDEMASILARAWPAGRTEQLELVPPMFWDYITYFGVMAGHLGSNIGVRLIVRRLREDYPPPPRQRRAPAADPSAVRQPRRVPGQPIRPEPEEEEDVFEDALPEGEVRLQTSLTPEEEARLRAAIVSKLGNLGGENQKPFLEYLSRHDPMVPVQTAAAGAIPVLETRVVRSRENYRRGQALFSEGKFDEAITAFELALDQNPDAEYREDVSRRLVIAGFAFIGRGEKDRAYSLLTGFIRSLPPIELTETATPGQYTGAMDAAEAIRRVLNRMRISENDVSNEYIRNFIRFGIERGFITVIEYIAPDEEFVDDDFAE